MISLLALSRQIFVFVAHIGLTRVSNDVVHFSNMSKALAQLKKKQRTNGPIKTHLISCPSKAQNIQILENIW